MVSRRRVHAAFRPRDIRTGRPRESRSLSPPRNAISAHAAWRRQTGAGARLMPPESSKALPFASVLADATWSVSAWRLSWFDCVHSATPAASDRGAGAGGSAALALALRERRLSAGIGIHDLG